MVDVFDVEVLGTKGKKRNLLLIIHVAVVLCGGEDVVGAVPPGEQELQHWRSIALLVTTKHGTKVATLTRHRENIWVRLGGGINISLIVLN